MAISIHLKVYEGGKLKLSRLFRSEQIRIGSGSCDLVLEGNGILPSHAVIDAGAGGAVLRSVGPAPLYLNGQPIIAAPLRHGDLISVGDLRVMVELRASAPGPVPEKRPRLQLIEGEADWEPEISHAHPPALAVVRDEPLPWGTEARSDRGIHGAIPELPAPEPALPEPELPEPDLPDPVPELAVQAAAQPVVALPAEVAPAPVLPLRGLPPLAEQALLGGECVEAELFWGRTRLCVWQLAPGEELVAGTAPGCDVLLDGIARAPVVRCDASGWTVCAPRPLSLTLIEEGRALGGAELLVRGRSQADAHGLLLPLPQKGVAVLGSASLALRIRRVPTAARVAAEPTDWRGILGASVAALLLIVGMKVLAGNVPSPKVNGEPEVIRPRPLVVRTAPKKPDPMALPQQTSKAQGRKDPGKAVARHSGQEGEAGSKTAPRRAGRAERAHDERAIVANTGLLKALGMGKGASDVFGVALEKGTRDAMGHLTGPKVGEARGDGGTGLKSLGGTGGGGDGSGLGLARIGTNGIGGGLASYGDGKGGLRGKSDADIGLGPGRPQVSGSIDPELIRKVVHEHRAQIRTCYETQLNAKPNLAGKLVSAWTIDQGGAVTEAHTQESTLRDHTVEQCVASKIKTWRFPIPKGGG
ncbi:MAG TPA: AgmX/PglI C-terminal domain-containing protein, partial [Myxococcales bacterium]|nr:AgmX/PglI C-terminal domain-containing protein [Myxococcales bacterium]